MRNRVITISASFFGVGYLPWCPGTWASLVAIGLYFLLAMVPAWIAYISVACLMAIGFMVCDRAQIIFKSKDSSCIVIDEAAAMLFILLAIPYSLVTVMCAFVLFRILDIAKPFPIKKIEHISGSWGIMVDDIMAACYTIGIINVISFYSRR